jgi:hypothetical protein
MAVLVCVVSSTPGPLPRSLAKRHNAVDNAHGVSTMARHHRLPFQPLLFPTAPIQIFAKNECARDMAFDSRAHYPPSPPSFCQIELLELDHGGLQQGRNIERKKKGECYFDLFHVFYCSSMAYMKLNL